MDGEGEGRLGKSEVKEEQRASNPGRPMKDTRCVLARVMAERAMRLQI